MAIYQIVVTRIDTIKGERIRSNLTQFNEHEYAPDIVQEVVVYEQRAEIDLNKIIMAVNGYTRTK